MKTIDFTHVYNSKNIESIVGEEFDLLVFSASTAVIFI